MGHNRSRSRQPGGKKFKHPSLLKRINRDAAGIDCGSETHYVAVPPERDSEPVRSFKTFTSDLHRLADWLEACKIKTVAMESTGVYWIPIFEILEERGLEVVLVNARHIKNVPGRKSDVLDCQWIQELHSVGLLRGSFRPAAEIVSLRAYLRHREKLVQKCRVSYPAHAKGAGADEPTTAQRDQRHHRSDRDAHSAGHRRRCHGSDGLAAHRDPRCRASQDEIAASLTGNYRAEHLFVLRQHLELFDTFQQQIQACDTEIECLLHKLAARQRKPETPVPSPRCKLRYYDNETAFRDPRSTLPPCRCRSNPDRFHRAVHRAQAHRGDRDRHESLADLQALHVLVDACSKNKITGGRLISSKTQPSANRAAYRSAHVCHGRGPHFHCPRRILPPHRLQDRQTQGDHRHGSQRSPSLSTALSRANWTTRIRSIRIRRAAPRTNPSQRP